MDCAVAAFKASLALNPRSWETHNNLALAFMQQGNFNGAAHEFRTVIREKPDAFQAHNGLGLALEKLGQLDAAADEFEAAAKISPKFFYASLNLAEANLEQKRYTAAIYHLRKALALSPPAEISDHLQMDLGVAYSENQQYEKASEVFKKLIARHPDSAQLHFNLATSYAHHEQYAEAAQEYQRALKLDPSNEAARISLAQALLETDKMASAVPYALKYTQDRPQDASGFELLGECYRKLGKYTQAAETLRRAARLDPQNYDARYNLGFALARMGQTGEAIRELEE
ncbi:MAG TPA: tetratricopeptide repeat protein, partial [Terriglobia bacterium]|nr:tetratricopeptide repeat protein [Terriglobia bacterium]